LRRSVGDLGSWEGRGGFPIGILDLKELLRLKCGFGLNSGGASARGEVRGFEGRGGGDGALEGSLGGEHVLWLDFRWSRFERTG